jgi:hypothetical protein
MVMDTKTVEISALSDDEIDAVSGGIDVPTDIVTPANQNALHQAQQEEQNRQVGAVLQTVKNIFRGIT